MSGMDRLTDEQLDSLANAGVATPWAAEMARELLAHRRASQAAPAPSNDACPCCGGTGRYGDACVRASHAAPKDCGYPCGYDCNGACFQAAPAPSDGLREALRVLDALIAEYHQDALDDAEDGEWTGERPDLYDHGISVPYATLSVIRAALSESPAQEGEPRHD